MAKKSVKKKTKKTVKKKPSEKKKPPKKVLGPSDTLTSMESSSEPKLNSKQHRPNQQKEQQPVNPEFEAAAKVEEPYVEKRGGVRPNAGKPLGMTDEKARVKNLPKVPSNSIKHGAVTLFLFWSKKANIEDLALTDEEADLWSLPATQLQENYFPGLIPEIMSIWIEFIYASIRIMESRFDLINEVRKQRREARDTKAEPVEESRIIHYRTDDEKPIHAIATGVEAIFSGVHKRVTCPTCREILKNQGVDV